MGARRAPINSMEPLRKDITPLVNRGLPSSPMASSTQAHLPPGQKVAGSHPAAKAGLWATLARTQAGRRDSPARCRPSPHCLATSSAVSARLFGRSLPPLAGPVQPSPCKVAAALLGGGGLRSDS
jgi:hypothetical protein